MERVCPTKAKAHIERLVIPQILGVNLGGDEIIFALLLAARRLDVVNQSPANLVFAVPLSSLFEEGRRERGAGRRKERKRGVTKERIMLVI